MSTILMILMFKTLLNVFTSNTKVVANPNKSGEKFVEETFTI